MVGFVPATRFETTPNLEVRFPPLPGSVVSVTELLSEPDTLPDIKKLADTVYIDPMVAISVLRRINSAYYGMRRRIGDVKKAVFLLGFLDVSNIVLTEGMLKLRGIVKSEEQVRVFEQIVQLNVGTAFIAKALAQYLKLPNSEYAYTAGLLHAIGRFILLYSKPNDYEALWWINDQGFAPSVDDERVIFGIDHATLGSVASDNWYLPEAIVAIIGNYQHPEKIDEPVVQLLCLCVSTGVQITEQLIAGGFASASDLSVPAALLTLAGKTHTRPEELMELIQSHTRRVCSIIKEFVRA